MQRWNSKREMMGDDPPYLAVGTEVSAKYKGAFCEAKVRKIVRSVKCKVAYKLGLGTATVTDDQIKGTLRAGATVEVRHLEKKEYVEAVITKIQDCSQYTVVFDDGDITTLRRTALCLKSGRHFAESETLDQLPLTHPEHFGNPVIGGRRGRRNRQDDSSDDEEPVRKGKRHKEEKEADIGKVVCVEVSEKKKQKDNWFPGLVVAPTAQDTVRIHVREDYLVRSFKDGRYYTVPKKEATAFTREIGLKVDNNTLRIAVEKALQFLDKDELPPHWDRELLFGLDESSGSDSDAPFDSDTSDDEPREEKDHFVAQLYKFMDDRGTPINKGPIISNRDVDLYKLFKVVHKLGGYNRVTNHNQWKTVSHKLGFGQNGSTVNLVKHAYKKFLHSFEDFYRKLGCTMVNHPRGQRARHRSNRSLIRDKDRTTVKDKPAEKETEEIKEAPVIEIKKEDNTKEDEKKIKDIATDASKAVKDSKKEMQRTRTARDEIKEKKEEKVIPTTSKSVEPVPVKIKEEKNKLDDREERIKMRELLKMDVTVTAKEEVKQDMQNVKNVKIDDTQKVSKSTRRDVKKEESDEGKLKKPVLATTSNATSVTEAAIITEPSNDTTKKSRSLFSRLTGNRKSKTVPGKIPRANNKQIGINAVRQKRSFTERMKAMVKKFKLKKTEKPENKATLPLNLPPLLSPSAEISDDDKKKKSALSLEEDKKKKLEEEKKKKTVCAVDEEKKKKVVSSLEEDKKKKSNSEEQEKTMPQLTRSKSKEEGLCVNKTRKVDSVLQENRAEKKSSAPPQPLVPVNSLNDSDKKRGRKRKDTEREEKSNGSDEILDLLPSYKTVSVGDKLKVYYGPTHESKVTYEAKVLNQKDEGNEVMYLVHYTGWNTRYDEWIKRSRIADNLSWNPGRAKRVRQPQQSLSRNGPKRGRRSESGGGGGARSTTPSSVTSSSSRTKSPAVSHSTTRSTRNKTKARRVSGHTDFSESESDEVYNSESDNESLLHTKQRNRIGSEIGDEDEVRKTDAEEDKDIEDRIKGINSSDEKEIKEENVQESVLSRMRSRSYRRKCDESKLQQDISIDKPENYEIKDDPVTETKGKKIKEEVEDTTPDEQPRDRTRSRSEKRKAEEINKLQPLNTDEIKKEVEEPMKNDRLRSRNDKRKVIDNKSEIDNENEKGKENALKDVETDKELPDTDYKRNVKTEDIEDNTDLTIDVIGTKKKTRSKTEDNLHLKDVYVKEENDDENQTKERRRSRRVTPRKEECIKSGTKEDDEPPKGRDFDLNQIRSELKGIDKAVKLPLDIPQSAKKETELEKSVHLAEQDASTKSLNTTADDIYEFKEPEPFEFEVRTKCGDEKGLKQMRTFGRMSEETINKTQSPVRRRVIRPKPETSSTTSDIRRRYHRNIKKSEEEMEENSVIDIEVSVSTKVNELSSSGTDNQNKLTESTTPAPKVVKEPCEEAFDKLVETPSFREVLTSDKVDDILQPLFAELPGESDTVGIDEDSEGRLVISETETETEPEGPLFSHQQRDHEDLFPTLISQQLPPNESMKNPSGVFSSFPTGSEIKESAELSKNDGDEEDDDEEKEGDCSISAVIKRVISQNTTDEDSSDADNVASNQNKEVLKDEDETMSSKIFTIDSESEVSQENIEDEDKQNVEEEEEDDDDDDSCIPLKIVEDEEKPDSPIIESIILNDSIESDSKLTINEGNEGEDDDNNENEEIGDNEDNDANENENNESSEKNEGNESKDEDEKEEENLIDMDADKAEVEETVIEEVDESEKGDENVEETVISQVVELSNVKTIIVETDVIEDEVVLEAVKEVVLEEECEDVNNQVQVEEDEEAEKEEEDDDKEDGKEVVEEELPEEKEDKTDVAKEEMEETESNLQSLLCEETIPGSPAPAASSLTEADNLGSVAELPFASAPGSTLPHYKPPAPPPPPPLPPPPPPALQPPLPLNNEAAPVMDNTPPTTPESSLSPISNSPRGERSGSSPVPDNDSSKSHRDSSEVDMDMYPEVTKIGHYSEEDTVCVSSSRIKKPPASIDDGDSQSSKKRRRSHRRSEDSNKRPKLSHRSPRHHGGSESDDTSENSLDLLSSHSRSPRPSKYNFYVQLDPELDGSQRIAVLQQKLAELRKTYMSVKTELACIDRRRKKLRRREREEKSLKPELSCS